MRTNLAKQQIVIHRHMCIELNRGNVKKKILFCSISILYSILICSRCQLERQVHVFFYQYAIMQV